MTGRINFTRDTDQELHIRSLRDFFTGSKPGYWIQTYGCQMNENDSQKIAGMLGEIGFHPVENREEADLVLINTCCVREHAESKVQALVGSFRAAKKERPELIVAVCGCMMQQQDVAKALLRKYPFVDLIFGTHQLHRFPELLEKVVTSRSSIVDVQDEEGTVIEDIPTARAKGVQAWLTIAYGCDNFCSYCIVPYVRGRERSRLPSDIVAEAQMLASQGVREITLLGQNVNSYGKGLDEPCSFPELLRRVHAVEGITRIRMMTSHPKDLSDELIKTMAELPKIAHHLHLPVQAGSDRVLREMNRHYTHEDYLALIGRLRDAIPDLSLTTDLIVGFPGETEEDFQDTLELVRKVRYDTAFSFRYSPREGTPAARREDQVDETVKKDRLARLNAVLEEISAQDRERFLNRVEEILVEGPSERDPMQWRGRTSGNQMVHFPWAEGIQVGDMIQIKIDTVKVHTLSGVMV